MAIYLRVLFVLQIQAGMHAPADVDYRNVVKHLARDAQAAQDLPRVPQIHQGRSISTVSGTWHATAVVGQCDKCRSSKSGFRSAKLAFSNPRERMQKICRKPGTRYTDALMRILSISTSYVDHPVNHAA